MEVQLHRVYHGQLSCHIKLMVEDGEISFDDDTLLHILSL